MICVKSGTSARLICSHVVFDFGRLVPLSWFGDKLRGGFATYVKDEATYFVQIATRHIQSIKRVFIALPNCLHVETTLKIHVNFVNGSRPLIFKTKVMFEKRYYTPRIIMETHINMPIVYLV